MPDINVTITDTTVNATIPNGGVVGQVSLGTQGPQGLAGAGFNYAHDQPIATTVWTITHNLGGYPNVTTVDSSGQQIDGDVEYISANVIQVTFAYITGGKAYLS
jgi:hypothetical protein